MAESKTESETEGCLVQTLFEGVCLYHGGTSNLRKHLSHIHPNDFKLKSNSSNHHSMACYPDLSVPLVVQKE